MTCSRSHREGGSGLCLLMTIPALVFLSCPAAASADSSAVRQGWLGLYTDNLTEPMLIALNMDHGVLVTEVVEGSPAWTAGFQTGDVVVEIDGEPTSDCQELRAVVRARPDKCVQARVRRRGQEKILYVTLQARSEEMKWRGHFPDFPRIMRFANRTLRKVGGELERGMDHVAPLDSLRKELVELRKELEQLKERLKEQVRQK